MSSLLFHIFYFTGEHPCLCENVTFYTRPADLAERGIHFPSILKWPCLFFFSIFPVDSHVLSEKSSDDSYSLWINSISPQRAFSSMFLSLLL